MAKLRSQQTNIPDEGLDFSGQATDILLADNTASALDIKEGTNSYIKIDTTNASELITLSKNALVNQVTLSSGENIIVSGGGELKGLPDIPTSDDAAASKSFIVNTVNGLDPKQSMRAATTAALPAVTYDNGTSGVGATLTANANGALPSQDDVSLLANDRLLVKDQVSGLENGLYEVTQLGDVSNPFILTRTTDADDEISSGIYTLITEGTDCAGCGFVLVTPDPITVGTTALTFTQFNQPGKIIAGDALDFNGNTLNVDINQETVKASPIDNDELLISDIADSNNIKKIQVGNIPFYKRTQNNAGSLAQRQVLNFGNGLTASDNVGSSRTDVVLEPNYVLTTRPAFHAQLSGVDQNISGDGTQFTIGSGFAFTEIFDQGSNFNTNGTFTAPITGRYHFTCILGCATQATDVLLELVTSNRTYKLFNFNPQNITITTTFIMSFSTYADMDISDTAFLRYTGTGGALVDDINTNTYFSGALLF